MRGGGETADVVHPTLKALNAIPGVIAYRIQCGMVRNRRGTIMLAEAGMPDIGCVAFGNAIYFECKTEIDRTSLVQNEMHRRLRMAGALVVVITATSQAIDIVKRFL